MKPYTDNRKARHDYEILETWEGGLVLSGSEVKSIREGGARLAGAYLRLWKGALWLTGAHISPYSKDGRQEGHDPDGERKVLLHKKELRALLGKTEQKGLTLVPLSLYPLGRRIKLSFALARGKKAHDKREAIKTREVMRRIRRNEDE
ncbi:SsrA-binding protein SmpB [Candidatus Uhrbacteria bacterium]|nr:SsrA-binding protein SmpB [Candidatus Uhrbacteria bacterium]